MANLWNPDPRVTNRIVDFVVLGVTFFASCVLFSVASGSDLFFQVMAYSAILVTCVRISKRAIISYSNYIGEASRLILGNGVGILIGTGIMILIEILLSSRGEIFVAIIFSSVMAFFILGTLSPIVHKCPGVHKKSSSF